MRLRGRKVKGQEWDVVTLTWVLVVVMLVALGAGGVTGSGHYAVSGPEYVDVVSYRAETTYLLGKHTLVASPPDGPEALLECMWACLAISGCATLIIQPSARLCYLSRHNRCLSQSDYLYRRPGFTMYEVRAADQEGHHATCLASCRDSQGCHSCGRPNCRGHLCDECATSCWTEEPTPTANSVHYFYVTPSVVHRAVCYTDWQLAWAQGTVHIISEYTSGVYQMLVHLYYGDKMRSAVFKDVRYTGTHLTVGSFVSGDAGNGWGAPFVNRVVVNNVESNLVPFFYASGSLSAGGVETYEEQMNRNATSITRGYFWAHSDPVISATSIHTVKLWFKP